MPVLRRSTWVLTKFLIQLNLPIQASPTSSFKFQYMYLTNYQIHSFLDYTYHSTINYTHRQSDSSSPTSTLNKSIKELLVLSVMSSARQFDLVLLGATGYTGCLAAEHIAKSFSTSLKWAIAGRSSESLEDLSEKLKIVNPDRVSPGLSLVLIVFFLPLRISDIEVVELNDVELNELALKTRVLINVIGPYHRFSSPILGACARNGTHYVDW